MKSLRFLFVAIAALFTMSFALPKEDKTNDWFYYGTTDNFHYIGPTQPVASTDCNIVTSSSTCYYVVIQTNQPPATIAREDEGDYDLEAGSESGKQHDLDPGT